MENTTQLEGKRAKFNRIAGIVLAIIIPISVISTCFDKESKPSVDDGGGIHGAWAYTQQFVEAELKSPSTAKFPRGGAQSAEELGGNRYRISSYVDSQNAYGATLRTSFTTTVRYNGGGWILEDLKFEE